MASMAATADGQPQLITRRALQELVRQIDPKERLTPEVEEVLLEIADDFIESITSFGCALAKHRKSDVLEPKDILLHLERNWFMRIPGFSGDEMRPGRRQVTSDTHKERSAAVRRSLVAAAAAAASGGGSGRGSTGDGPPSKVPRLG